MKTIKKISILLMISSITFFSNCKKEVPADNVVVDNVVSSSITSSAWVYNNPYWEISFSYPAITQEIINSGAVLVYVKDGNSNYQLPVTIYTTSTYSSSLGLEAFVGGIKINWSDSDLTQPDNPGTMTFKVVVISSDGLIQNPKIDFSNYETIKEVFNVRD